MSAKRACTWSAAALMVMLPMVAFGKEQKAMPRMAAANAITAEQAGIPTYLQPSLDSYGTYVRLDAGLGLMRVKKFRQWDLEQNRGQFIQKDIGDAPLIGAGIGLRLNDWLRLDITGEHRANAAVKAFDNLALANADRSILLQSNTAYTGNVSSTVGLLNAYLDLGQWQGFTPFVGAGIGVTQNRMSGFSEQALGILTINGSATNSPTQGILGSRDKLSLAWALMVGTSFQVTRDFQIELSYRHLNLGSGASATTGVIQCTCGSTGAPLKVTGLSSNDIRIGLRWNFGDHRPYVER